MKKVGYGQRGQILSGSEGKAEEFRIMVSSDLHYLSPVLMEYSGAFRSMCEALQEPEMEKIESLMDHLFKQVLLQMPDIYLITGDRSYQGEKMSHLGLAAGLEKLVRAGIHVYVVPGNQDVENPFSMCWKPEGEKEYTPAESVSTREFQWIYREMGYGRTDSSIVNRAPDSLSYHVCLQKGKEELHLFMLDTTIYQMPQGEIAPGTLEWLEQQLKEISGGRMIFRRKKPAEQEKKISCLIAGHHPMLPFGENPQQDYILKNSSDLCRLMRQYQVPLYVSGHLHRAGIAQAEKSADGIRKWFEKQPVNISLEKRGLHSVTYREFSCRKFLCRESESDS